MFKLKQKRPLSNLGILGHNKPILVLRLRPKQVHVTSASLNDFQVLLLRPSQVYNNWPKIKSLSFAICRPGSYLGAKCGTPTTACLPKRQMSR